MKSRASNFGRNPDELLIFPSFVPFVGETESIAREKQAYHNELADPISGLVVPGIQGLFDDVARRLSVRDDLTLRDIGKLYAQGVLLPQFVGTAEQIADQIEEGFRGGEADGYILSAAQAPGTFHDFVDYVVPELQHRGLFRTDCTGTTLRDHLGLSAASLQPVARKAAASA